MELDLTYGRRINGELEDYPVGGTLVLNICG
jgi:hypothetical protein